MDMIADKIVLALVPITFTIMGYLIYRKPRDMVDLIKAMQDRWDIEKKELQSQLESLVQREQNIVAERNSLQNAIQIQVQHLHYLVEMIHADYPDVYKTIQSWRQVYSSAVKDGLASGAIRADVFVGRSGLQSTHDELNRFLKLGLVDIDQSSQEVRILKKGHVLGKELVPG